jgi:hypothetical protein
MKKNRYSRRLGLCKGIMQCGGSVTVEGGFSIKVASRK